MRGGREHAWKRAALLLAAGAAAAGGCAWAAKTMIRVTVA